jgi:L-alanine-DL-glutamate epimerase-like enolase superfamily enzyme
MQNPHIVGVEWARLEGRRPRSAGSNARLGEHGIVVRPPIARITAEDGSQGFGFCGATREQAAALVGRRLDELYTPSQGVGEALIAFEYPLWDLAGRRAGLPVYELAAAQAGRSSPAQLQVPCYDTSLYFDDLHLEGLDEAVALIASEARSGYERGHRAFKIKVGRGARWMALEDGTRRDIAVIRAVREAVGQAPPIMIDANNGYNFNIARQVLAATADCSIFWLEEAFHEDPVLYRALREWLASEGLATLIADGEGLAAPALPEWAQQGLVDVLQYDIFGYGFTRWLALGRSIDSWGVRSAPHHYGVGYGNYVSCHLASAIEHFTFVEWDEADIAGLDASAYVVSEGMVHVPNAPGFGLNLDERAFRQAVAAGGYEIGRRS